MDSTWRPPRSSARAPSHAQGPAAAAARRARQARRSQRQAVAAERREQGGPERQFSDSPSPSGDDDDLGEEAEPSGSGLSEDERRGENRRQGRRAGSLLYRLVQRVQSWLAVAVAWSGWQLRLAGRGQGDRGADLAGRHNTHTQGQLQLQQQRRRGGWLQWCARVAGSIGRGFAAAWPSVMAVWSVLMGALAGLLAVMALDLARAHMSWGGTPTPIPIDAPPIQHTPAGGQ